MSITSKMEFFNAVNEFLILPTESVQDYLIRLGWLESAIAVNEYVGRMNAAQDIGFYVKEISWWPNEDGCVIEARPIWRDRWIVNDGMDGRGPSFEFVRPYLDCVAGYYEGHRIPTRGWMKCDGPARMLTPKEHVALLNLSRPNNPPITKPIPKASVCSYIFSVFK